MAAQFPRRLLETCEMVRLAETNAALQNLWRELLEDGARGARGARASGRRTAVYVIYINTISMYYADSK